MPEKSTPQGDTYRIDGKKFIWTTGEDAEVTIPLRMKLGHIREIADQDLDNIGTMFNLLDRIAPGQGDALDEMDVNEFVRCFTAWQREYNALNGATLGESGGSSS